MVIKNLPFGLGPRRRADKNAVRYGDIYMRGLAAAIDFFPLIFLFKNFFDYMARVINPLYANATAQQQMLLIRHPRVIEMALLNRLFEFAVVGVIYVCVQIIWGTTPGRWIVGLRIVKAKTFEAPESWRYIKRYLAYIPAVAPFMLGFFWASFNRERRGWHDYIAGTVVINTRPSSWYWWQVKKLYFWLRGRSRSVEQSVSEPTAEQGD